MPPTDKISLKTFWETVELRLAACSAEQLRAIVRAQAQEVAPNGRQAFLDKLGPIEPGAWRALRVRSSRTICWQTSPIWPLRSKMRWKMRPSRRNTMSGAGTTSEEEDDPYAEFVEPLVALFDRAQAAFDYGDQQLAREAYAALFEILDQQDDYGRGIMPTDLTGVDISEAWARYLRAVYETEPADQRPETLLNEMLEVRTWVAGARPKLDDLIQISPAPLPDRDKFLADWIAFLRGQPGEEADTWLREAIRLAHGTAGLEALARGEGKQRPRAYLDWFTALAQEGKHREVLAAAQEAFDVLPAESPHPRRHRRSPVRGGREAERADPRCVPAGGRRSPPSPLCRGCSIYGRPRPPATIVQH